MANHDSDAVLEDFSHSHDHGAAVSSHERRTRWVVALTLAMMIAELIVGYTTNSMALTADGWHMATHAGALGLAAFAYWFARKRSGSTLFSFGTGKVHALAGYTSAIILALVALLMIVESVKRFFDPQPIGFSEALPVAVLGLLVNLVSVKLLHHDEHHHGSHGDGRHDHNEGDAHNDHHGHDHNLRAAYFHVLADALTSVLAILALLGGRLFGWSFLDAVMGIVGGALIARWSYGLCLQAGRQLLDVVPSRQIEETIRDSIEQGFPGARIVDLHLWDIGPHARACIASIAAPPPSSTRAYRDAIMAVAKLEHLTIEVDDLNAA